LDSDDLYKPDYLKETVTFYNENPNCDFVFYSYEVFSENYYKLIQIYGDRIKFFGCSVLRTLYQGEWIGSLTSTLSIRRNILDKLLPIPFTDDWIVRAVYSLFPSA